MKSNAVFSELNAGARAHTNALVHTVIMNISQRPDVAIANNTKLLQKLQRLWEENLKPFESVEIAEEAEQVHTPLQPVHKHPRLDTVIQSSQTNSLGRPAQYMVRPAYACDVIVLPPPSTRSKRYVKKSDRLAAELAARESQAREQLQFANRSATTDADAATRDSSAEHDVILGTRLQVQLAALLTKHINTAAITESTQWIDARVISITSPELPRHNVTVEQYRSKTLTLRLRFKNGAELDVKWPDRAHLRTVGSPSNLQVVQISNTSNSSGPTDGGSTSASTSAKARAVTTASISSTNILDRVFGSNNNTPNGGIHAGSDSEDDTWGCILGSGLGSAGLRGLTAIGNMGASLQSSLQSTGDQALRILLGDYGQDSANISENTAGTKQNAAVHVATAHLATGERVSQAQLTDIESIYGAQYKPRFQLMPAQNAMEGDVPATRKRKSFTSRRWTDTTTASNTDNTNSSGTDNDAVHGGATVSCVQLSAEEDPLHRLPEPETFIIGRAIRLTRGEGKWDCTLVDVYVHFNQQYKQLVLPRCRISLDNSLLFSAQGDSYWVQNHELLIQLLL